MYNVYYIIPDILRGSFSLQNAIRRVIRGQFADLFRDWFPPNKPIGGVKVMYQHCQILRGEGVNASVVLMGKFHGKFFDCDVPTIPYSSALRDLRPNDVVIIPEYIPSLINLFKFARCVIFVQNWSPIYIYGVGRLRQSVSSGYIDCGFAMTMACTNWLDSLLIRDSPGRRGVVSNFIDHTIFYPLERLRIPERILAMPRKNPNDLRAIVGSLGKYRENVVYADNLMEIELINEYRRSDIFIATGYPEGLGLPSLEAMACGCVVVGFTGRGGDEFMIHEDTALIARDGDVNEVAALVKRVLNDAVLKERLRARGREMALRYSVDRTRGQLINFYQKLDSQS